MNRLYTLTEVAGPDLALGAAVIWRVAKTSLPV